MIFIDFANGITRFGLTTESYQKIRISLPLLPEQKRIVNLLDTSKKEIDVLKQLAEQYRTQKRGLMQKLLTAGNGEFIQVLGREIATDSSASICG